MPTEPTEPTRSGVPAPPGGHALRIDPAGRPTAPPAQPSGGSQLPVVQEISAGGLVVQAIDGALHAAIIARRNRAGRLEWCLPKGHLEGDETMEAAAVREIAEETGILGEVDAPLGTIDYWFAGDTHRVHKIVHHYLLRAVSGALSIDGDPDREAEEAAWVEVTDLPRRLSYPNERRLAVSALRVLSVGERVDAAARGADRAEPRGRG